MGDEAGGDSRGIWSPWDGVEEWPGELDLVDPGLFSFPRGAAGAPSAVGSFAQGALGFC